jgi:hypothetical protein
LERRLFPASNITWRGVYPKSQISHREETIHSLKYHMKRRLSIVEIPRGEKTVHSLKITWR